MAEGSSTGSVSIGLDEATLAVDARPGVLVAVLPQDGGPAMAVAMSTTTTASSAVPAGAKRFSFRVTDELSIEASPSSTFVALRGEDGRLVVSAFSGEVVVRPFGADGERFAISGHEVLVAPPGAQADAIRVTPTGEVADDDRAEIEGLLEAATAALGRAVPAHLAIAGEPAEEPTEAIDEATATELTAEVPAVDEGAPATEEVAAAETPAKEATAASSAKPAAKPAGKPAKEAPKAPADGGKRKGKTKAERKLERSEAARRRAEEREKRAAAADAAAGEAAAGAPASTPAKKASPTRKAAPTKKAGARSRPARDRKAPAAQPPESPAMKKPTKVRQAAAGAGGAGTRPRSSVRPKKLAEADEERRERRALPLMLLGGVVIAAAVLFFATRGDDRGVDVAQPGTTEAPATTAEPATTAAPTTEEPATTAAPTTTVATTTTVAAVPNYSFVPKSCEQDGQEITYTAEVTNKAAQAYDFVVQVLFKDSDGRTVAETTATVDSLGPNRTATVTATGTSNRDLAGSGASCNVEKIDATPA